MQKKNTALDFKRGYTWSEEWRQICEARWLLSRPLSARRNYLLIIENKRGRAAADSLKAVMTAEFGRKRK